MDKTDSNKQTKLQQEIGKRFLSVRLANNLTQADIAEQLGRPQNYVYRMEKDMNISLPGFFEIVNFYARNYDVNPAWLMLADNRGELKYKTNERVKADINRADSDRLRKLLAHIQELISENIKPATKRSEEKSEEDTPGTLPEDTV